MVARTTRTSSATRTNARMVAVTAMAQIQRYLFEVEREFLRTVTTLIYRVGSPELKFLLCHHAWESAGHARFLRERGREMAGFGNGDEVRPTIAAIFNEAVMPEDPAIALAGFYKVLKPALRAAYARYLIAAPPLADWPSRKLVEEFLKDEERHEEEMKTFLDAKPSAAEKEWTQHLLAAVADLGGFSGEGQKLSALPTGFVWEHQRRAYQHPSTCNRGKFPICSSVFSEDPAETPIVRSWLTDPKTDARIIRLMVYVWLMMEMDAVDYLATVFYDTPHAPFDLHHDMARHLWDESRHSAFGYKQLPRHGVDLMTLEHSLDLYNILVQMPPHERYAMMTMEFEAGSFPTKAIVMDRVRELSDFEADTLLAFDRNDEQNHVRYGHHWLPVMMKLFDEQRPIEEFVRATQARFQEMAAKYGGKTPHSLPPERRLTGNRLREIASREKNPASWALPFL